MDPKMQIQPEKTKTTDMGSTVHDLTTFDAPQLAQTVACWRIGLRQKGQVSA